MLEEENRSAKNSRSPVQHATCVLTRAMSNRSKAGLRVDFRHMSDTGSSRGKNQREILAENIGIPGLKTRRSRAGLRSFIGTFWDWKFWDGRQVLFRRTFLLGER